MSRHRSSVPQLKLSHPEKIKEYKDIGDEYARRGIKMDAAGDDAGASAAYGKALAVWVEGMREPGTGPEVELWKLHMKRCYTNFDQRVRDLMVSLRKPPEQQQSGGGFMSYFRKRASDSAEPRPDPALQVLQRSLDTPPEEVPPPPLSTSGSGSFGSVGHATPRSVHGGGARPTTLGAPVSARAAPPQSARPSSLGARAAPAAPLSARVTVPQSSRGAAPPSVRGGQPPPVHSDPHLQARATSTLLKKHDRKLVEAILNDIVEPGSVGISWDDVTGLERSKQHLREAVVLPMNRPDLFSGLRAPPRGVLLFGPPGNGKTMLAKAVASESRATFFSISASSLVSKFLGDGEKMVKCLFACAFELAPSVVFIDEVDSLLTTRGEEHDAMRRLKTEVLVQVDGVGTQSDKRMLVLAATNRPQDIDSACLRRFTKRIYIPLPDAKAREQHIRRLCGRQESVAFSMTDANFRSVAAKTERYSFSDLTAAVKEAAMQPLRRLGADAMTADARKIPPVRFVDFEEAMQVARPSAAAREVRELEQWADQYGTR